MSQQHVWQQSGARAEPNPPGHSDHSDQWRAPGQPWRTAPEIPLPRQAELAQRRSAAPDPQRGAFPFAGVALGRADVEWLLATHDDGRGPVDWDDERERGRVGIDLRGADLRGADLRRLPLARTLAGPDTPEGDSGSSVAHLEWADLGGAHLEGAALGGALLHGADLRLAHLEGADLHGAHLEGKRLTRDEIALLDARGIQVPEVLPPADLRGAFLDPATNLQALAIGDATYGAAAMADLHWGDAVRGANMLDVDWSRVKMLGDERVARQAYTRDGQPKDTPTRTREYAGAIRANQQLATAARAQGMGDVADYFGYRGQRLQRTMMWRKRRFMSYVFSLFLDTFTGYGYKPARSLLAYLYVVLGFAIAYFALNLALSHDAPAYQSLLVSLASVHGRAFVSGQFQLSDPLAVVSVAESVTGVFVEAGLVAAFTQRLAGR